MFTITFSVPTLDVLTRIADAVKNVNATIKTPETTPTPDKPARLATVSAVVKEAPEKAVKEDKQVMPGFLGRKENAVPTPSFEAVKTASMEVVRGVNRETGVAILRQFGAKGTTDLKPEHYADFIRTSNEVLENHNRKKSEETKKDDDLL